MHFLKKLELILFESVKQKVAVEILFWQAVFSVNFKINDSLIHPTEDLTLLNYPLINIKWGIYKTNYMLSLKKLRIMEICSGIQIEKEFLMGGKILKTFLLKGSLYIKLWNVTEAPKWVPQ